MITQLDMDVLVAFAENGMVASRVARQLFMHRNTVEYHLEKVKTKTGLDPRNLFHLAELLGVEVVINKKEVESEWAT